MSPNPPLADLARARLSGALIAVGRGDRAALAEVYALTSAKLFGICLRICRDRDDAEDVLQAVYVKVWQRAGRFDPARASPITWLATIARNSAIDRLRATPVRNAAPIEAAQQVPDERPLADSVIEEAEQQHRVHLCMSELEARARAAISAAFFGGATYAQLAEREAVPLGTMKTWIRRGLLQLRACLGRD
ncbi:sigma-70 family RNA polymerase sigma factor [Sphingomonas sp. ST-64]|uniref:RNA polymerase sigma factor n=1 Tax=Sphingomonas plantiphila TaxID=3163295 RepID=A0ABW8YRV4_9SPHN